MFDYSNSHCKLLDNARSNKESHNRPVYPVQHNFAAITREDKPTRCPLVVPHTHVLAKLGTAWKQKAQILTGAVSFWKGR